MMVIATVSDWLLLFSCFISIASLSSSPAPHVFVPGMGSLEGAWSELRAGVALFKGIPYAKPPVGDLRWRAPQPYGAWQSPRNASYFRSGCITLWKSPEQIEQAEDCLYLNIATPQAALQHAGSSRPVMVYIHGGAFSNGNSNHARPDTLVSSSGDSVIVVNMNYRLNVFGFLGARRLQGPAFDTSTGNFGIEDQRLALTWVQQHISAFGGRGNDVTIFGESAGGSSVLNHLVQPMSFGLYAKAIIESGTYDSSFPLHVADSMYHDLLITSGCKDLTCLQKLPPDAVTAAAPVLSYFGNAWGPVIDNVALHGRPQELVLHGKYNNKVPILIGSNRDETALWLADPNGSSYISPNLTVIELDSLLSDKLGYLGKTGLNRVMSIYEPAVYSFPKTLGNYSLSWWKAMRISTDGGASSYPSRALGHCSVRRIARLFLRWDTPRVFIYMFSHPSHEGILDINEGGVIAGTKQNSTLVPHASELPYSFGWHEILHGEGEKALATMMSKYWSRFAIQGDPNEFPLPIWPRFEKESDTLMHLDIALESKSYVRKQACDLWDDYAWTSDSSLYIESASPLVV